LDPADAQTTNHRHTNHNPQSTNHNATNHKSQPTHHKPQPTSSFSPVTIPHMTVEERGRIRTGGVSDHRREKRPPEHVCVRDWPSSHQPPIPQQNSQK
jgi:hypothetical protein